MDKDIEALAIKCGFIPHAHEDGESYASLEDLQRFGEAFVNELTKPQEAAAEIKKRNEDLNYIHWHTLLQELPDGTELYTAPPNHVALVKENERLREAIYYAKEQAELSNNWKVADTMDEALAKEGE